MMVEIEIVRLKLMSCKTLVAMWLSCLVKYWSSLAYIILNIPWMVLDNC